MVDHKTGHPVVLALVDAETGVAIPRERAQLRPDPGAPIARRYADAGYRAAMLARDAGRLAALEKEYRLRSQRHVT